MATIAVKIRVIVDNEIPSQFDEVSMEAANELFKSVSGLSERGKEEKIRERLPNSSQVTSKHIATKVTKFIGRRDKETLLILFYFNFSRDLPE